MSVQPITPLTIEPTTTIDPDWFDDDGEDVAEKIARDIEARAVALSQARRRYAQMNAFDYEVDEIISAVYRSCAGIARGYKVRR